MTASHVIPATESTPAMREYECGCTYWAPTGWSHCQGHTTVHGVLSIRSAAAVSQAEARRTAWLRKNGPRVEVRECHGGTMTLYHYDRPSWESKEDRP